MKIIFGCNFFSQLWIYLIVVLFFLTNNSLIGQKRLFVLSKSTDLETAQKFIKIESQIDTLVLDEKDVALYYFRQSSIYTYLKNNKKAKYYLNKSFKKDSLWFCKKVSFLLPLFRTNKIILENNKSFFIDDISTSLGDKYLSKCKTCCDRKKIKNNLDSSLIKQNKYSSELIILMNRDQKYRNRDSIIWRLQDKMDSENRRKLDTLFQKYGFPSQNKVGKEAQRAAWLVLQHSTDCDWNKKWILTWLNAYQKKEYRGGQFLDQTIKRFFEPKDGFCKEGREQFIKLLKETYPEEYGKLFSYHTY